MRSKLCASHWILLLLCSHLALLGIATMDILLFQPSLDALLNLVLILRMRSSVNFHCSSEGPSMLHVSVSLAVPVQE